MKHLALFMTYGSSLSTWREAGILRREMALYEAHQRAGYEISIVTYGGEEDLAIGADFPFLSVLANRHGLHLRVYGRLAPLLHASALARADVYKTNQLSGAHVAAWCARLHRKPLLVRQGYGHYEHRVEEHGASSRAAHRAWRYEHRHLRAAQAASFTTRDLAARAVERHGLDRARVHVVPNYVVPADWSPPHGPPHDGRMRVCFFGRFTEQKNLPALIGAMQGLDATLELVGEGPLRAELEALAAERGVRVTFHGRLEQGALREVLRGCDVFALPSLYEGHPKALLETMALGMPVLAADSPGIREQVADGRTAVLAAPDEEGLRAGLRALMADDAADLRQRLGTAAREEILDRFGVDAIAAQERTIVDGIGRP